MTDPAAPDPGSVTSPRPKIVIHPEQAAKHRAAVTLNRKLPVEAKYNIKLLRQDYDVIKAAGDSEGRSASYFVSFLLYDHIARELDAMREDSEDALLMLAALADASTEYDIMSTPWVHDMMSKYLDAIVAAVTGTGDGDLKPLEKTIAKYRHHNSHQLALFKLMGEFAYGAKKKG